MFAEGGYAGTSMRAIAAGAGVDPALAAHFFGSKENLFRQAVGWPFDPAELVRRVTGSDAGSRGERLARAFLEYWEDPDTRRRLLAVLRAAMTHEESAGLMRQFVRDQMLARLGGLFEVELAASQLVGIAVVRYVLRVEPLASEPVEDLVQRLAPTLDHYLGATLWGT